MGDLEDKVESEALSAPKIPQGSILDQISFYDGLPKGITSSNLPQSGHPGAKAYICSPAIEYPVSQPTIDTNNDTVIEPNSPQPPLSDSDVNHAVTPVMTPFKASMPKFRTNTLNAQVFMVDRIMEDRPPLDAGFKSKDKYPKPPSRQPKPIIPAVPAETSVHMGGEDTEKDCCCSQR